VVGYSPYVVTDLLALVVASLSRAMYALESPALITSSLGAGVGAGAGLAQPVAINPLNNTNTITKTVDIFTNCNFLLGSPFDKKI